MLAGCTPAGHHRAHVLTNRSAAAYHAARLAVRPRRRGRGRTSLAGVLHGTIEPGPPPGSRTRTPTGAPAMARSMPRHDELVARPAGRRVQRFILVEHAARFSPRARRLQPVPRSRTRRSYGARPWQWKHPCGAREVYGHGGGEGTLVRSSKRCRPQGRWVPVVLRIKLRGNGRARSRAGLSRTDVVDGSAAP